MRIRETNKTHKNKKTALKKRLITESNELPNTSVVFFHFSTYFQVTSRLSLRVPRSFISTATIWVSGANRSFISQETFPTTT